MTFTCNFLWFIVPSECISSVCWNHDLMMALLKTCRWEGIFSSFLWKRKPEGRDFRSLDRELESVYQNNCSGVHGFPSFHIFSFSFFLFSCILKRGYILLLGTTVLHSDERYFVPIYFHHRLLQEHSKSASSIKQVNWEEIPPTKYLVSWKQRRCRKWGEIIKELNFCLHKQMFCLFCLSDVWEGEKECA